MALIEPGVGEPCVEVGLWPDAEMKLEDEIWVNKDADPVELGCTVVVLKSTDMEDAVEPETLEPPSGFGICVDKVLRPGAAGKMVSLKEPIVVLLDKPGRDKVGSELKDTVIDGTS